MSPGKQVFRGASDGASGSRHRMGNWGCVGAAVCTQAPRLLSRAAAGALRRQQPGPGARCPSSCPPRPSLR